MSKIGYFADTCAPIMPKPHMIVSYDFFGDTHAEFGRRYYGTKLYISCGSGYSLYRPNTDYYAHIIMCGQFWSGAWDYPAEKFQCVNSSLGGCFYTIAFIFYYCS